MTGTKIFQKAIIEINNPFTKEGLLTYLENNENWHVRSFNEYFKNDCKGGFIEQIESNLFIATQRARDRVAQYESRRTVDIFRNTQYRNRNHNSNKIKVDLNKTPLTPIDALKFILYTIDVFDSFGNEQYPASDRTRYMTLTDELTLSYGHNHLSPIGFIFERMAYHVQNQSELTDKIKFVRNEQNIIQYTHNFEPSAFLNYANNNQDTDLDKVKAFLGVIGREESEAGVDSKNKYYNYFLILKSIATYLASFENVDAVVADLHSVAVTQNIRSIFYEFKKRIQRGFGIALTYDFLKEFDASFDYPKPDLHVIRTLLFLMNDPSIMNQFDGTNRYKPTDVKNESLGEFNAIEWFLELRDCAYEGYKAIGGSRLNGLACYVLDKMIYIICSGKWYLEENYHAFTGYKIPYLRACVRREFGNIDLETENGKCNAIEKIERYFSLGRE